MIEKNLLSVQIQWMKFMKILTLFRMGFSEAADGWREDILPQLPKMCHTYPTMVKLGTVIPSQRKIQKMYKSRDTFLEFC